MLLKAMLVSENLEGIRLLVDPAEQSLADNIFSFPAKEPLTKSSWSLETSGGPRGDVVTNSLASPCT